MLPLETLLLWPAKCFTVNSSISAYVDISTCWVACFHLVQMYRFVTPFCIASHVILKGILTWAFKTGTLLRTFKRKMPAAEAFSDGPCGANTAHLVEKDAFILFGSLVLQKWHFCNASGIVGHLLLTFASPICAIYWRRHCSLKFSWVEYKVVNMFCAIFCHNGFPESNTPAEEISISKATLLSSSPINWKAYSRCSCSWTCLASNTPLIWFCRILDLNKMCFWVLYQGYDMADWTLKLSNFAKLFCSWVTAVKYSKRTSLQAIHGLHFGIFWDYHAFFIRDTSSWDFLGTHDWFYWNLRIIIVSWARFNRETHVYFARHYQQISFFHLCH